MSEFKQSFNEVRYLFPFTTFRSPVLIHINEAEGWGAGERWGLERSQRSYWGTQKGCSIFFECEDMYVFPLPGFSWRMESQQQCGIRHLHGRILQCVTILPAQWCGHYCHPSSASTTYGQCHVYIADSERPQPHRPPSSLFYFVPQESHSQAGLATAPHPPQKISWKHLFIPFDLDDMKLVTRRNWVRIRDR